MSQVNHAYPDGFLSNYFDAESGAELRGSGDTLALFIVREAHAVCVTGVGDAELAESLSRALQNAQNDLQAVIDSLQEIRRGFQSKTV